MNYTQPRCRYRRSLVFILVLLAAVLTVRAPRGWAEEEDADAPTNVQVRTKRASIGSRSLPRLTELTEEHSPTLQKARNVLERAQLEHLNARVTFFPSLDANATHGLTDTFPNPRATPYLSQMNLVLTENLYDNGQAFIDLDVKKTRLKRARLEYEYVRDEQLRDMAVVYLDWSSSSQMREIDENKRDLLRRQFNVLEAQYKQGLKTKRDVLRIETEMRRLEMSILERDNEVDLGFQKLAALVGVPLEDLNNEDIEGEEPRPYVGSDPGASEIKAPVHRKSKILELIHREKDLAVRSAQRWYWPQINLNGTAGYHNADYLGRGVKFSTGDLWDWTAQIVLTYNIWDFGTRRRNIQMARIDVNTQASENAVVLNTLGNDLRDNWNKLRQYREQVKMSRELLSLEQQSYSILEAEYRNGRASYLDLITNLNTLIDARSKFIQSYFGLRKAQTLYGFHKGDLYDNLK